MLTDDALVQLVLHVQQARGLLLGELHDRDAGRGGQHLGDGLLADGGHGIGLAVAPGLLLLVPLGLEVLLLVAEGGGELEVLPVDRLLLLLARLLDAGVVLLELRRSREATDAQTGAGLVDQIDRLVREEAVVDVAVGEVGRGHQALSVMVTLWCAS